MLKGKSVIVTGSTSGIGLAIARACAKEGSNITINGFGPKDAIEKERAGSTAVTTSTIEIAVVEGKSGKIIGVVRGHGRVEAAAGDDGADEDAVKAAAKGAVDSAVEMARAPGH